MPVDERGPRRPAAARAPREIFRRFLEALEPLRATGKLGGHSLPAAAGRRLQGSLARLPDVGEGAARRDEMLVEFRHRSWLDDEEPSSNVRVLEDLGATYVTVDAPKSDTAKNLVPTVPAVSRQRRTWRFHRPDLGTWNKRGGLGGRNGSIISTPTASSRSSCRRSRSWRSSRSAPSRFSITTRLRRIREPARPHLTGGNERAPAAGGCLDFNRIAATGGER